MKTERLKTSTNEFWSGLLIGLILMGAALYWVPRLNNVYVDIKHAIVDAWEETE